MKGRITKKEKENLLKSVLVSVGTLLIYFSVQDWLMENLPLWLQVIIGGGIVFFALKKF